jgi:hypothetical protein
MKLKYYMVFILVLFSFVLISAKYQGDKKLYAIAVIVKDKPPEIVSKIKKELEKLEKKYSVELKEVPEPK